jgi:hypothetical protein
MKKKIIFELTLVFCLLLSTAALSPSQTVVNRSKIGGYAEDIAFVASGALKDKIVMINSYDLYAVPRKKPSDPMQKLFSIRIPEIDQFPTGVTYIESEQLFALNNDPHPDRLYLWDQQGVFRGTRPIQYLNPSYRPAHMEGLTYIPSNSPTFPDHLALVVWDDLAGGPNRIEIMRRDGVVVSEIFRADWPEDFFGNLGDVAFLAPNRLLVSTYTNSIWTMDFNGNILSGPITPAGATVLGEGIVQMSNGNVVAANFPQRLLFFDSDLARLPQDDRNDLIGLNLNVANGIAWNSATNQFNVTHDSVSGGGRLSSVTTTLDTATQVADMSSFPFTRQAAYLSGENLTAVLNITPVNSRAILLFNSNGTLNSQISLSPAALGQNLGGPLSLAYIPTTNEFVVGFNGVNGDPGQPAERRRLRVFSRTGSLVRTIDITATGSHGVSAVEYFEDPNGGGGRLMLLGSAGRVIITDLNGDSRNAQGLGFFEFNIRAKLGLITRNDIAAITTGPLAGAFAVTDANGGEVVIFRLD